MILSSIFLSILFERLFADPDSCAYFYESELPVVLNTCYWTAPGESYGYYCVESFNGTTYDETMVVQLGFFGPDCVDGPLNPNVTLESGPFSCSEYGSDCHCDGQTEKCVLATQTGCNSSYLVEETYVIDVCISGAANIGGGKVLCDEDAENLGVYKQWYDAVDCSGSLRNTPAPTYTPAPTFFDQCRTTTCPASASTETGMNGGVIAAVVILVICLFGCCIVGIVYYLRRRKHDQYFEDTDRGL